MGERVYRSEECTRIGVNDLELHPESHSPNIKCSTRCLLLLKLIFFVQFRSVKSLSHVHSLWSHGPPTPGAYSNSLPLSWLMSSNHLILCRPLLLPSIFPSIQIFSNESVLQIRWPKYWSFSFSISLNNEYSGLISFRMDLLDLLEIRGTLRNLLQHHSSKALILQCSAFFIVQLTHPYVTTGKTMALTRWTFVSKLMSLLFNMLSRLVIAFLPRSKCLLISWLQLPSGVILEPPKKKVCYCFHCFPIYLPCSDGSRCNDVRFLNIEF